VYECFIIASEAGDFQLRRVSGVSEGGGEEGCVEIEWSKSES